MYRDKRALLFDPAAPIQDLIEAFSETIGKVAAKARREAPSKATEAIVERSTVRVEQSEMQGAWLMAERLERKFSKKQAGKV